MTDTHLRIHAVTRRHDVLKLLVSIPAPSRDSVDHLTVFPNALLLRAVFSRWAPERPELLIRFRTRLRHIA